MKEKIHPEYGPVSVQCACGNVFETRSTVTGTIRVEICSMCHPFFTGKQKIMDTAGRIDRFKKKFGEKVVSAAPRQPKSSSQPVSSAGPKPTAPSKLSLKDKLQAAKEKAASKLQ